MAILSYYVQVLLFNMQKKRANIPHAKQNQLMLKEKLIVSNGHSSYYVVLEIGIFKRPVSVVNRQFTFHTGKLEM